MACNIGWGRMVVNRELKMLVLLLLVINSADFSQGKALQDGQRDRGKRYYSPLQSVGIHQTYDPQSNAEHWMKGNFYEPQVDGQPIYVPALDQPGSYQEFLDRYYKAYTPAQSVETPVPYTYSSKDVSKQPPKSVVKGTSDKGNTKYKPPLSKEKLSAETAILDDESEDYDIPEVVDKTVNESNEKSGLMAESEEYDDSEISDKTANELSEEKSGLISESEDYDTPEVIDKTIVTELSEEKPDLISETKVLDEFEEAVLQESLKSGVPKTKPKDDKLYNQPSVIKTVKQKPKTSNTKKDVSKKPSMPKTKPQMGSVDYEKPVVSKKPSIPKTKPQMDSVDDYEKPVVSKKPMPKTKPQMESDDYEKPIIHKSVKVKPNKRVTTVPTLKYGEETNQGTRKKSKGKRRKQYSKSNKPRTSGEINQGTIVDPNVDEALDELTKKDLDPYTVGVGKEAIVKTESEAKPVKIKGNVKTNPQYKPVKNEKVKPNSKDKTTYTENKDKPIKPKDKVVVQTGSQYQPDKEKAIVKSDSKDKPMKKTVSYSTDKLGQEGPLTRQLNDQNKDLIESDVNTNDPLEEESVLSSSEVTERELANKPNSDELATENENSENKGDIGVKLGSNFPNTNDFRGLSSMNSNIWSMLFNPNAEQNRLKQKRCITRSNETGFCTYIQNCEVPHIATSLEQLLNNACVIDDIFIGVCCPEFPVETVKVHWDQTPSDFDNQIEDEFGHNTEDCGIRSNEAIELQNWPWKAPLVSMSNGKIFCGGVIVSEDHVLTAAHCTTKIPKNQILVRLGQFDDASGDDYAVIEIKRHAQYNPRTMHNDVALLKLGRRIMNDAHIGIVCLPDEGHKNDHDGETATLLGWRGIFGTKSRDPEFLEVISNKECENKLGMKVPDTTLCTETRKESGRTCNADSGAPLVIEDDGRYEVIGILSWNRNDCDQRFPSTFSRVSSYTGWIKNHIS